MEIITRTVPKFQKITKVADGDKILKINFSKLCHPCRRLWTKIESTISPDHVFKLETHLTMDIDKILPLGTMIQHEHHEIVAHLLSSPNMDVNYQACEISINFSAEIRIIEFQS